MFDEALKELEKLQETKLYFPVDADLEGYYDRECPSDECKFQFKISKEDWDNIRNANKDVYCPLCRHQAGHDSWWTTEQIEEAKSRAISQVKDLLGNAFRKDAEKFNRNQRKNSFIKMNLSVKGFNGKGISIPIPAKEAMELKIKCEKCGANFCVIGSAFFCPCCGFNSVERTFEDSLNKVRVKLDNLDIIKTSLESASGKDEAEITCRSLVESCLSDIVVAFQRLAEKIYLRIPNVTEPPFNVFQRIDDGSKLWKKVCNQGYENWLNRKELMDLKLLFQKRHLLAHCEGIVDQRYIDKSGDNSYKVGQRIVIKVDDINELLYLIEKITKEIRKIA
jgi:uncharacterized Zn finger protein (UPF0148 family)